MDKAKRAAYNKAYSKQYRVTHKEEIKEYREKNADQIASKRIMTALLKDTHLTHSEVIELFEVRMNKRKAKQEINNG